MRTLFGVFCVIYTDWWVIKCVGVGYVGGVRWTTDEIYVPRNGFIGAAVQPEVKKDAAEVDVALRDVLFDVLRRFEAAVVERLKRIEHVGPALAVQTDAGWELAFPAPADAVLFPGNSGVDVCALRPDRRWTATTTMAWLDGSLSETDPAKLGPGNFDRQRRIHLEIDPRTFTAKEGRLFTTEALEFGWENGDWAGKAAALCSQIRAENGGWASIEAVAPLGGERRLAYWSEQDIGWPMAPGIRMRGSQRSCTSGFCKSVVRQPPDKAWCGWCLREAPNDA